MFACGKTGMFVHFGSNIEAIDSAELITTASPLGATVVSGAAVVADAAVVSGAAVVSALSDELHAAASRARAKTIATSDRVLLIVSPI